MKPREQLVYPGRQRDKRSVKFDPRNAEFSSHLFRRQAVITQQYGPNTTASLRTNSATLSLISCNTAGRDDGGVTTNSHIARRAHVVPLRVYNSSFPFDLQRAAVFDTHLACHAHAVLKATSQGNGTERHAICELTFRVSHYRPLTSCYSVGVASGNCKLITHNPPVFHVKWLPLPGPQSGPTQTLPINSYNHSEFVPVLNWAPRHEDAWGGGGATGK